MKYSDFQVAPLKGYRYKVLKEVRYKDLVVERGYRTNGADIPRIFWSFIPPYLSDTLPAVIIHDKMCDIAKHKKDYEKADKYLDEVLTLLHVATLKRKVMVYGVMFYTKFIRNYNSENK